MRIYAHIGGQPRGTQRARAFGVHCDKAYRSERESHRAERDERESARARKGGRARERARERERTLKDKHKVKNRKGVVIGKRRAINLLRS